MARKDGRFFVIEGLDGAGTTTQVVELAAALRARDLRVLTTRGCDVWQW